MRRVLLVLATLLCLVAQPWPPVTPTRSAEPSHQPAPGAAALSGTVSSKQQVTLPGMATVRVELIDLSAKDPRSALVGEDAHWIVGGKLPVDFRIAYDPSRIDPAHVYVVRARVIDGDKVLLMSTAPYYVLTRGALKRPVDIVVVPEQSGIR
jgi:putative lipoprotein